MESQKNSDQKKKGGPNKGNKAQQQPPKEKQPAPPAQTPEPEATVTTYNLSGLMSGMNHAWNTVWHSKPKLPPFPGGGSLADAINNGGQPVIEAQVTEQQQLPAGAAPDANSAAQRGNQ